MSMSIAGKCPFCGNTEFHDVGGINENKCHGCGAEYYYTLAKLPHFKTDQFWFTRKDKNNEIYEEEAGIDKLVAETNERIDKRKTRED